MKLALTLASAASSLFLLAGAVHAAPAADAAKPLTPQQQRMSTCNANAKDLAGDERKDFMSRCLKGEITQPEKALSASQQRMRDCNAQASAKALKGDERKTFMSTCLKAQ
ncbi:PsiF family protein [Alcaligenes sp. WGS1538]|uniref:PsiF family protein n=1 Tax=Alcaligenes sp. WGS1538 TaxID=3366811 RepID=UPI00372D430A